MPDKRNLTITAFQLNILAENFTTNELTVFSEDTNNILPPMLVLPLSDLDMQIEEELTIDLGILLA